MPQSVNASVEKLPSGRPETFGVPGICLRGVDVLYGSSDFSLAYHCSSWASRRY